MALDGKRARTWQEIADDASQEKDPEKLKALSRELERALAERDAKLGIGPSQPHKKLRWTKRHSPSTYEMS